ncbi:hypothetical protein FJ365_02600 [Candidatus Dependentiae bacterium]|nr:hypothetical protein [Candidatus Dependentiae bacterium]
MKLRLTILTLAAGLALSPLCQAAKRHHAEEAHGQDSFTPRNMVSILRARETTGRITTPFDSQKKLLAHRCKQLENAIAAGADQAIKDELKRQINSLIFSIQTPTRNAIREARAALTGKTLAEARAAFALLPDADELTKMAYRFLWWLQHETAENLDPAVNVKEVFAAFSRAGSTEESNYIMNLTPLQQLQNANQLTQLLIDLVLCNPDQQGLDIRRVGTNCSLTITSTALTWLYANNNADLTALDLSNCPALTALAASNNQALTALDLSNCPALTALAASNNPALTALDLSNSPALTHLYANDNPGLASLNLSNNPALTQLSACDNPGLTTFRIAPGTRVSAATITQITAMVAANRARLGLPAAGNAGAGADDAEDDE